MSERVLTRSCFCMDSLPGEYEGYTDGSLWNGWECPLFEKTVAVAVLEDSISAGLHWKYDEEEDAFLVGHEEDPDDYEPEVFSAVKVNLDGEIKNLYAVGAYAWVWVKCGE